MSTTIGGNTTERSPENPSLRVIIVCSQSLFVGFFQDKDMKKSKIVHPV